jgi:hypothetical protein
VVKLPELTKPDGREVKARKQRIKGIIKRVLERKPKELDMEALGRTHKYLTNKEKADHYREQGE